MNTHKTWLKSPNVFLLNVMPWVGEVLWSLRFSIGFSCPGNSVPCCLVVSGGAISELREEWLLTIEMTPCLTPFLTSWMTPWMTIFNIADQNCNIMTVSNSCNLVMKQLSSIWFLKSLKRLRRTWTYFAFGADEIWSTWSEMQTVFHGDDEAGLPRCSCQMLQTHRTPSAKRDWVGIENLHSQEEGCLGLHNEQCTSQHIWYLSIFYILKPENSKLKIA